MKHGNNVSSRWQKPLELAGEKMHTNTEILASLLECSDLEAVHFCIDVQEQSRLNTSTSAVLQAVHVCMKSGKPPVIAAIVQLLPRFAGDPSERSLSCVPAQNKPITSEVKKTQQQSSNLTPSSTTCTVDSNHSPKPKKPGSVAKPTAKKKRRILAKQTQPDVSSKERVAYVVSLGEQKLPLTEQEKRQQQQIIYRMQNPEPDNKASHRSAFTWSSETQHTAVIMNSNVLDAS